MGDPLTEVTELLVARKEGDDTMSKLLPYVYEELRSIARGLKLGERRNHTLDTSALVHEAYFKLVDANRTTWDSRAHFFGAAARAMRQVLVDYARMRNRHKRGGGVRPISLDDARPLSATMPDEDVIALDDALARLEALDARQCRVVECRYFAGMTIEETATALEISSATVKREWATARAWLYRDLKSEH